MAISLFQRVHPEIAVALDVTDEQPVTWFTQLDDDQTVSAAMLDFFNSINEDGTLARLEEKYLGHGDDFDYVDTRTFLRAVDSVLPDLQPLFEKYAEEIDWKLLAAISYQESHWDAQATSPHGRARVDDADQKIPPRASASATGPMRNRASAAARSIYRI